MPQWAKSLSPIAEHVAHVFGKAMDGTYSAATSLTSRRHRDAQEVVKASASDIRRGKWTPHVSTWAALGQLVGVFVGQAPSPA